MDKYYSDETAESRDVRIIMIEIMCFSKFSKVTLSFYKSLLGTGKGSMKLKKRMKIEFQLQVVRAIEERNYSKYEILFKVIHMWITARYIEMETMKEMEV